MEELQRKTLNTLKSPYIKKVVLFLVGLELLGVISNKASDLSSQETQNTGLKHALLETVFIRSEMITKSISTILTKSFTDSLTEKDFQDKFIEQLKQEFWFDGSKEYVEEMKTTILQILSLFDLFQQNPKSSFHLIHSSHLLASAMEESRFGKRNSYRNQLGVYQIMPIAIADMDKRYDLYKPLITPEIAHIFGFKETIPQEFFDSLYCGTDSTYDYTEKGRELLAVPEKNIALGMLIYLSIEKQILQGNLLAHRKEVITGLQDYAYDETISLSFLNHIERYVKAKGLSYDEEAVTTLFHNLKDDKEMQRLFAIFSRFNGHPDNKIYYGFKVLLHSTMFDKILNQTIDLQKNLAKKISDQTIVSTLSKGLHYGVNISQPIQDIYKDVENMQNNNSVSLDTEHFNPSMYVTTSTVSGGANSFVYTCNQEDHETDYTLQKYYKKKKKE